MITVSELRELLNYDPSTGHFTWRVPRPKVRVGARAGYTHYRGYRYIEIGARAYAEHRLAWLYVMSQWPKDQLDHRNRCRDDNRFENLREATNGQNRANSTSRNRTGFKGVTRHPWMTTRPYEARIRTKGRTISLGCFSTPEEAHQAYVEAARRHHGEFAHGG